MTTQYKPRTDPSSTVVVGRVGSEKAIYYSDGNGKAAVLKFTVAVSEAVGKADNLREETTWYRVVCFGGQAEQLHDLDLPGSRVAIVGRLRDGLPQRIQLVDNPERSWEHREKELIPLVRGGVRLLGRPNGSTQEQDEAPHEGTEDAVPPSDDDDTPF